MGLTIERTDVPKGLRLEGELDIATAPALDEAVRRVTETPGPLTIDVCSLDFIDSTALLVFWKAAKALGPHGGLTVVGPRGRVKTVFALTGFERAPGVTIVDAPNAAEPTPG